MALPSISSHLITGVISAPTSVSSNTGGRTADTVIRSNIENQLQRASAQNEAYLNEAKDLYDSYANAGASSLDEYMKLLLGGVNGLSTDSNYQAMKNMATRDVMANRATSGLLRSGATASALNDSLLNFANSYYGNRLKQLEEGVGIGQNAINSQSSILEKLGGNATDLASALANIQMQREGNQATIQAAQAQAGATKSAANSAANSSMLSSLATAGTIAMLAFSDARLKKDLKPIGKVNDLTVYEGRFTEESGLDDGKKHKFLLAQEVKHKKPDAVVLDKSGYYKIDYNKALED